MSDNKNTTMSDPGSKIRQFRHEIEAWKRSLEFIIQENSILKNRLAEVLNTSSNQSSIIDESEQYQNCFVQTDEYIWLIRKEIDELDQLLLGNMYPDDKFLNAVIQKQKKLSADMQAVAREFNKMKSEFSNYLGEIL